MFRALKLALFADIGATFVSFIIHTINDGIGWGLISIVIIFIPIYIPSLIAVGIYLLIKPITRLMTPLTKLTFQCLALNLLLFLALFIQMIGCEIYYDRFSLKQTFVEFTSAFNFFGPMIITESVLIPFIDQETVKQFVKYWH